MLGSKPNWRWPSGRRQWRRLLHNLGHRTARPLSRVRSLIPTRPSLLLAGLAVLILAVSVDTARLIARLHHPAVAQPSTPVTVSTDRPSEDVITASNYRSTAVGEEPKYLRLPSIKAEGYVQKVGVDQNKQIAVPTNIHLAGWFSETVTPGDLGLSIIDGHLDGYRKPGIFIDLTRLKAGDGFSVELANGTTRNFQVKTVQSVPTKDAAAALFSQTPGINRQLSLITCGGTFNKSDRSYDHRVIVVAQAL